MVSPEERANDPLARIQREGGRPPGRGPTRSRPSDSGRARHTRLAALIAHGLVSTLARSIVALGRCRGFHCSGSATRPQPRLGTQRAGRAGTEVKESFTF